MARKRDISLTLALCLSLVVHGWIMHQVIRRFVADNYPLYFPGLSPRVAVSQVIVPDPPPQANPPLDRFERLGDVDATGDAIADSPGDNPLRAPRADQTQAALSLDAEDTGRGGESRSAPQPMFTPAAPVPMALPGSEQASLASPRFVPRQAAGSAAGPVPQPPPKPQPQPPTEPAVPAQPALAAAPSTNRPGERADPAVESDRESDAFSTAPYAEFTRGGTRARIGRKHRLVNPRLEMAGYGDLMSLRPPVVLVLRITINSAGNVIKADIVKSTGSINLDQPVMNVVYRWWFEPRKDGMEETFEFACRFL